MFAAPIGAVPDDLKGNSGQEESVPFSPARKGHQARSRRTANPIDQCGEMWAVFLKQGGEFQSESFAGFHMPHNRFGPDLSFLNKKIQFDGYTHRPGIWCRDE
jgi:hypothetical protein